MIKVDIEILGCRGLGFFTESNSSSTDQSLFVCERKTLILIPSALAICNFASANEMHSE